MENDPDSGKGDIAQAVDTFFDRIISLMPVYVGRLKPMTFAALISFGLLLALLPIIIEQKRLGASGENEMQKRLWILYLVILLLVILKVFSELTGVIYNSLMIQHNKQHYANVHWVAEYARAKRSGATLTS